MEDDIARYFFHQLVSVVEYMHSHGYAHRDIKLDNILLDKDCNVKIADFGLALPFDKENELNLTSRGGTVNYFSPEMHYHAHFLAS